MKLFLSYPSAQRDLADRLALALEAEGHQVFIDRSDLAPGDAFHQSLREAILGADAMVFLVTPESVATGSYALAELSIARQRWRRPAGCVLPVLVAPTPIAALPPYLRAVTLLQPRGDAVAETVAAVARLTGRAPVLGRGWVLAAAAAAVLALAVAGVLTWRGAERTRLAARRAVAEARSALELCQGGGHARAFRQLDALAGREKAPPEVSRAREDCAMAWLRGMHATSGKLTFAEQVAQVQPVLVQALGAARGERAADLRAHLGWGEYLLGREGNPGLDPVAHWKRALEDDGRNPYAQAMWARKLLDRDGLDEAKVHFAQAVASGRDRPFVRQLELGGTLGRDAYLPYALVVLDEMRRGGERLEREDRERVWSAAFSSTLFYPDDRAALLGALPGADLLATFTWLFPAGEVREDRRPLWRLVKATLDANAGHRAEARADLEALIRDLRATRGPDRVLAEASRTLERLGRPAGSRQRDSR